MEESVEEPVPEAMEMTEGAWLAAALPAARLNRLSPEASRRQHIRRPVQGNWQLSPPLLDTIVDALDWTPVIDACSDSCGLNALAPLYFDAIADTLKRAYYLKGRRSIMNPPFNLMAEFVDLVVEVAKNKATRILLVSPLRWAPCNEKWMRTLDAGGKIDMVALYAPGQPLFSAPARSAYEVERGALRQSVEPIAVFEVRGDGKFAAGAVTRAKRALHGGRNLLPILEAAELYMAQRKRHNQHRLKKIHDKRRHRRVPKFSKEHRKLK